MAKELTKRKTLEELIAEDARSPIPTLQQPPALSPVKSISNVSSSISFQASVSHPKFRNSKTDTAV